VRYKCGQCKPCKIAGSAKWKRENKDKEAIIKARYYQAHSDAAKERNARNYQLNKDRKSETVAEWQRNNPEKVKLARIKHAASGKEKVTKQRYYSENIESIRASSKAWRDKNPDSAYRANHARRSRKLSVGGILSKGLRQKLFVLQRGKCACCGKPLGEKYHLDHIMPLSLGGTNTDDNIQLLRQRCNSQKHKKHPVDFMQERGYLI
jgi:5-methylcytosine-specific restriction endonuclease McrA